MKNPLVDALRQASDHPTTPEEATPQPSTVASEHRSPDMAELQLLDTLAIDPAATTANDELDASFYETTSLQNSQGDDERRIVSNEPADVALMQSVAMKSGRSGMPKLGSYSPLLCLGLLVATSTVYFVYRQLGGHYQNIDLQVLSSQIGPPGSEVGAPKSGSELYSNPFQLIRGSHNRALQNDAAHNQADRSVDTLASEPQSAPQVVNAAPAIPDSAFAALNDAYQAFEAGDLAALLMGQGDLPAAVSEIKYQIQRFPKSADLNFALGTLRAEQSRWVDARHYFGQAVQLDAGNADYLFNLGLSLERLGKYDDARHFYEAALQAANTNSAVHDDTLRARLEQLALLSTMRGQRQ